MTSRRQVFALAVSLTMLINPLWSQEQSRESMAVDATASQWSFQFAYEGFFDYRTDEIAPGVTRPEGNKGFLQFRLVTPISKSESNPLTWLPRLTLRAVQNKTGDYGFGSSDLFVLGILDQWSTGRWGLGPQINFPAGSSGFGNTNWGYGLAGAITERALNDKLFLALLLQQTWRQQMGGSEATLATPLGINLIFVYQLGDGYYIGNGDFVINYNWYDQSLFVPFGVRVGRAFIGDTSTWNAYVEYSTSLIYKSWNAPVASHALRVNVQYQVPVGM
ncbi:MAG: hypothetical protein WBH56_04210 [Bacteroidota bacterium]